MERKHVGVKSNAFIAKNTIIAISIHHKEKKVFSKTSESKKGQLLYGRLKKNYMNRAQSIRKPSKKSKMNPFSI